VRVNAAAGALLTLAGDASVLGFADGVGSSARFYGAYGIALNTDESALVIVDSGNRRIRKLLLANNSVTTVAGSGASGGLVDGQALTATFSSVNGAKWHCKVFRALLLLQQLQICVSSASVLGLLEHGPASFPLSPPARSVY
jgi:sugar lactone lactonase YvrE